MKDFGKRNVLGVLVDALDYEAAVAKIIGAAREGRSFSGSALAVHGVMTGRDDVHRYRLNRLDLVTPDGQPVRWALNLLHRTHLQDRVYGPTLMLKVCSAAAAESLPIYLYGSSEDVVARLSRNLQERFPGLQVAGAEPSQFRRTDADEKNAIAARIGGSGAKIAFVGLGCPRQEVFAFEYRDALAMPIIGVGAAFDYHAGVLKEPPKWVQRVGLQWLYRLAQDPRRLWKRYVVLNSAFLGLLAAQAVRLWRPDPAHAQAPSEELRYA